MQATWVIHPVLGGSTRLVESIGLKMLGLPVWVRVLCHATSVFPLDPPTLVAVPLAFAVCIAMSPPNYCHRAVVDRAGHTEQSRRIIGGAAIATAE